MKNKGFTLIELLTVIAIIGILGGLIFGAIQMGLTKADQVKCQTQLNQLVNALTSYKQTYGYYPRFLYTADAESGVNLSTATNTADLHKALTSRNIDGSDLSVDDRRDLNPKLQEFISFGPDEIVGDVLQGPREREVHIAIDLDEDGFIRALSVPDDSGGTVALEDLRVKVVGWMQGGGESTVLSIGDLNEYASSD